MSEYLLIGKNILVDFNLIGSKVFPRLNIQRKILHFIFFHLFTSKPIGKQDQTHLLLKDLIVGIKLIMMNDVFL